MINKVGEKIKLLRKELNMTQTELAGEEMTKSMLSQIENNVSNPSIKTLNYIAKRLNKPISYFLDDADNSSIQMPDIAKQSENQENQNSLVNYISSLIDSADITEARKRLEEAIKNNTIENIKNRADLLLKFGNSLINLNNIDESKRYIKLSINLYIDGNFYIEAAKAYVSLGKAFYEEFNYEESLTIAKKAFDLYNKSINKDPLFEIELCYYEILFLFAIGSIKETAELLLTSISLSAKTSIYYKTDEFFRLSAIFNYLIGNIDEYKKNLEKALKFAQFTEDKICLAQIYTTMAIEALESNNAQKALEYAEKNKYYMEKEIHLYHFIKARAYFILGDYKTAYENIIKVDFPEKEKHKFDYLHMWSAKVYEGLILNKLGNQTDSVDAIKFGIDKMSIFNNSKFIVKAYKALSEVYSDMNDFQNAFIYLKKSNEIQDAVNKDDTILF